MLSGNPVRPSGSQPFRGLRAGAAALVVVTAVTGLGGCSSPTGAYCSTLKGDQHQLQALSRRSARSGPAGTRALGDTVTLLAALRDRAPDSVAADWDTLVRALQGLSDAVRASGASPAQLGAPTPPRGVTEGQLHAVQQAAAELRGTPVQQAASSIEQHAQDVCHADPGAGLGGVGG